MVDGGLEGVIGDVGVLFAVVGDAARG